VSESRFEEFCKAMAPTVGAMRALTDAITAVAPRHGYKPEPGCEAEGELKIEEGLKGEDDMGPAAHRHPQHGRRHVAGCHRLRPLLRRPL
jgi:hypothetical protein